MLRVNLHSVVGIRYSESCLDALKSGFLSLENVMDFLLSCRRSGGANVLVLDTV